MKNTIVWFRKDLRTHDNPALWAAAQQGPVIPVFIGSPEEAMEDQNAAASLWWLHHSLLELTHNLQALGAPLVLRKGSSLEVLRDIIRETNANALFFNERYEPAIRHRDEQIKSELLEEGIQVESFASHLLFQPQSIANQQGQAYKVYTPFWKQCLKMKVEKPVPTPDSLSMSSANATTIPLEKLGLLPKRDWHQKLESYWKPGETEAMKQWTTFLNHGISDYPSKRDFPSSKGVSQLSPHLAWGEISPKWVWQSLLNVEESQHSTTEAFKKQLIWREFAYHQLIHFPHLTEFPLRPEFHVFPWEDNEKDFTLWKKGRTGYPLVDAGMRELWETGYMHNRVRMITASFLVKHLLIPWTKGATWFADTLVDYDVANNAIGWQWVTGCGIDASPYFRIFNPVKQGESFDPHGDYVRQWVPELSKLPTRYIHQPWKAPKNILQSSGITLGVTYPTPIVEHEMGRERALVSYRSIKSGEILHLDLKWK